MKKTFIFLLSFLLPLLASADAVEIDGIYYELNQEERIAKVTKNPNKYTGSVDIPNIVSFEGVEYTVTSIGVGAFMYCSNLTFVKMGNSVTLINADAFCSSGLISITIPNSVKSIGDQAFYGCGNLSFITIQSGVTSIGSEAFKNCISLSSISIPDGVISINKSTFENCIELSSVSIPSSVTSIDEKAFRDCVKLTSIVIPPNVATIGRYAFFGCKSLTSINIPNGVTTIEEATFQNCSNLTSINFSDNSDLKSIGKNAFYGCKSLILVSVPDNVTTIEDYAFSGCYSISSLSIPNSLTTIGSSSFSGCSDLTTIVIPDNVTTIGTYAFSGCRGVTSVSISNAVTKIEYGTFQNCNSIASVKLPDNLKSIASQAFYGCWNLQSIIIPSTVEVIYQRAFSGCNSLKIITVLPEIPPFLYDNSFSNYSIPVKVPKGYKDTYKTAPGWRNFTSISDVYKYKLSYYVDNEEYKTYEIDEESIIIPEEEPSKEGYTFSGWSEIPETMPAHDVSVSGSFFVNSYILTYMVDDEVYKTLQVEYCADIIPEDTPQKTGYAFTGWSEIPETMPAHDVIVTGSFVVNKYQVTYIIDGEVFATDYVEYGAAIVPPTVEEKEGLKFSGWADVPETMPAHNITIYGSFTSGIAEIVMATKNNVRIYSPNGKKIDKMLKGLNIVVLKDGTVKKIVVK